MDPKGMAAIAKKAAKGSAPEHHEPDGDENADGSEPQDHDEDSESSEGQDEFGGKSDKDVSDFLADGIEQGIVSPAVKKAMDGYDPEQGKPEWAEESLWNRAVNAVQPNGQGKDEHEDPWLVVASFYHFAGGSMPESGEDTGGDELGDDNLDTDEDELDDGGGAPEGE